MRKLAHAMGHGLLALLLVGPFFVISWQNTTLFRFPKTIFAILTAILLLVVVGLRWLNRVRYITMPPAAARVAVLAFVGLVLWSVLTLPWAHLPHRAGERALLLAGLGLLCLGMRTLLRYRRWRTIHTNLLIAAAVLTAIYAIIQFYGLDPIFCEAVWGQDYSCVQSAPSGKLVAGGFLGNPNFVGMALAPAFFLSLGLFIRCYAAERAWPAVGYALAALCLLFGIRASESKTAAAALAIGLAAVAVQFLVVLLRRIRLLRSLMLAQAGIIILLIGVSLWLSLAPLAPKMITALENLSSGRLFAWRVAGRMGATYPLTGIGLGGYQQEFLAGRAELLRTPEGQVYSPERLHHFIWEAAHNEYLQIFAELGIPGLILVVIFFLAIAWLIVRHFSIEPKALPLGDAGGRLLEFQAWMALVLAGVVHYPFQFPTLTVLAVFATALVLSPSPIRTSAEAAQAAPHPEGFRVAFPDSLWLRRGMQVSFCIVAGFFFITAVNLFRADLALETGRRLLTGYREQLRTVADDLGALDRRTLLEARDLFQNSIRLYPWYGRTWYLFGNSYLLERAPDKAMAAFLRGLLYERTESLHYAAAVAAHARGYLARAQREYVRLLSFTPNSSKYGQLLTTILAVNERLL